MRATVLGLGLLLLSATASADIYHFTDRDGVVHYTNVQPRGGAWRRLYHTDDAGRPTSRLGASERKPDPQRLASYDEHIREASQLYQLPEAFIRAIVLVESNFYPDAISEAGAMGLMQLMPATAVNMGVMNAFDPRQNVLGGTRYLRVLANRFNGDLVLTVAAYNAGEGAIERYKGVPPYLETRRYVQRVLHHYYQFRNATQLTAASARTMVSRAER
ncbi:MAG: lytic transglycosylase domain-containing protein [Polyangiales bacterium]